MDGHEIKRIHGGPKSELGWIQAVCSCGWTSRKEYAYNMLTEAECRELCRAVKKGYFRRRHRPRQKIRKNA